MYVWNLLLEGRCEVSPVSDLWTAPCSDHCRVPSPHPPHPSAAGSDLHQGLASLRQDVVVHHYRFLSDSVYQGILMARQRTTESSSRASSSPPSRTAAAAAARAAEAAEAAAREALRAAAEAARAAEREAHGASGSDGVQTSVDSKEGPPPPNKSKKRFFYVREYPGLEDGIYTTIALRSRGVDPDEDRADGLLKGWIGTEAPLRAAQETGVDRSTVFWV